MQWPQTPPTNPAFPQTSRSIWLFGSQAYAALSDLLMNESTLPWHFVPIFFLRFIHSHPSLFVILVEAVLIVSHGTVCKKTQPNVRLVHPDVYFSTHLQSSTVSSPKKIHHTLMRGMIQFDTWELGRRSNPILWTRGLQDRAKVLPRTRWQPARSITLHGIINIASQDSEI